MTTPEILSLIAIGMSSVSLSWQIASWRRSGAVVTVTARNVIITGHEGDFVVVEASNSGRTAVTVTTWGFEFPGGGGTVVANPLPMSTEVPHRLEAGAQGQWFISSESLMQMCDGRGVRYQDVVAFVKLGDGRTVNAKKRGFLQG